MGSEDCGAENAKGACLEKTVGQNGIPVCRFEEKNPMIGGYGFGDMVWGKVKSHPWWPGQVYDEALAVTNVNEGKMEGQVLVAFFGDDSYGWFYPAELLPFDAYYAEKLKQTNANSFKNAVEHAEYEVSKRAALGLVCHCTSNFKLINDKGLVSVDVRGYEPGGLYAKRQVRSARSGFQSVEMLNFIKHLALFPCAKFQRTIHWLRNVAIVVAYRRSVFHDTDRTYIEPHATQSPFSLNFGAFTQADKGTSQDDSSNCPESARPSEIGQGKRTDCLSAIAKPPKKRMKPFAGLRCVGTFNSRRKQSSGVPRKSIELRSSSIEKKFTDEKSFKSQGNDHQESVVSSQTKPIKNLLKKQETQNRVAKAAVLVLTFPSQSTLPSVLELKIKFRRFGPFDGLHIFWKSSTCQIVFKNEYDALVACRYAVRNPNLFGSVKVQYKVQALLAPGKELANVRKRYEQDASDEAPMTRPSLVTADLKSKAPQNCQLVSNHPEIPSSKPQHNKPQFTSTAPNIDPKVKSTLSGDHNKANRLPGNGFIQKQHGSYANVDIHKSRTVYQFAEACNRQYLQVAGRNNHGNDTSQNVDISRAMLSLLNQCSAILADLKSTIGYVPNHL